LFLFRRRKDGDDTVNAFHRIQGVQGGEDHVAGFSRMQRRADGFQVAHFADQDHVWILTQTGAQGRPERGCVHFNFALVNVAFLVAMQNSIGSSMVMMCSARVELMRSIMAARVVDLPDPVTLSPAPARAACRRSVRPLLGETVRPERGFGRDDAKHQTDVAALLKDVDTEPSQAGDAVSHVDFRGFFEFLLLARGHHAKRHVEHVLGRDTRLVGERNEVAIDAQVRIVTHLQVQVGSAALHGNAQQVINIHAEDTPGTPS